MTQVISFLNLQRGGGKTITVLNLATALHQRGASVLAVDLDPDAALFNRVQMSNGVHTNRTGALSGLRATAEGWLLMPATLALPLLQTRALYRVVRNTIYQDEIGPTFESYDYVLIDGSTDETTLLAEALSLSDQMVVPLDSESREFQASVEKLRVLLSERVSINTRLRFGGAFLARYAPRRRRAREMLTALFDALGPVNCFSAYLPDSEQIRQAERRRSSVLADAPDSRAARVFVQLAEQLAATVVPRTIQSPNLHFTLSRDSVVETGDPSIRAPAVVGRADATADWLARARQADDPQQAVRYAVLALPSARRDTTALALFNARLTETLAGASAADAERLTSLGQFLTDNGLDSYAVQVYRRATELAPGFVGGWTRLAQTTDVDAERVRAREMCLQLDRGLAYGHAIGSPSLASKSGPGPTGSAISTPSTLNAVNV
jgi:chromosome partitioning protein